MLAHENFGNFPELAKAVQKKRNTYLQKKLIEFNNDRVKELLKFRNIKTHFTTTGNMNSMDNELIILPSGLTLQ